LFISTNCSIDVTSSSGSEEVDGNNTPLSSSTEVEVSPSSLSPSDTTLSISDDSLSAGPSPVKELTKTLRITVREDGSVDWEEALASGMMA
jgi:uncharacterized glyoxalase superfamily protein PhnB